MSINILTKLTNLLCSKHLSPNYNCLFQTTEFQLIENYDEFGFFKPDFLHVKNGTKRFFSCDDVIHFKNPTHKSNAWGVSCLPVAVNIEILEQIKTFDFNNFKNGLLVDYFMIVEGGSLKDDVVEDSKTTKLFI